jgi:hypothetical protein
MSEGEVGNPYGWQDLEEYLHHKTECRGGHEFAGNLRKNGSFFLAKDGYMGIGSRKMRISDKICAILASEVLFLLRPVGEDC